MIDERELPFTEAEFAQAFRLVVSERRARKTAAHIRRTVREAIRMAARVREARERGSTDPNEIQEPSWYIGDPAFALLALVSDDLRLRVDNYMRAQWAELRARMLRSRLRRPDGSIMEAPDAAVQAEVDAEIAEYEAAWDRLCEDTRRKLDPRKK